MIIVQGHVETEWESGRRSTPTMPAWHQHSSIDVLQVDILKGQEGTLEVISVPGSATEIYPLMEK